MGYNTSRYRLGDLCEFYRGASVPRTRMHDSGDCLYIHYGDLYKGFSYCIDVERQQKPIPYILSSEKIKDEQRLLDQDIVYVLTSETVDDLGHSFLFNNPQHVPAVAGTETTIVRVKDHCILLPAYLNYLMHSPRFLKMLRQYVRGMKVFRVHPRDVARIEIELPAIETQRETVLMLDAIHEKLLVNVRTNGYLHDLVMAASKSIYREIETTDAPLPDGWRWVEVEEIAELVSRGITPKYDESSAETVLGQTCVRNNLVLIENGRHHKPKKINEKWLREGDLLINSTGVGSLGRTAQVWFEPEKLTVDSHITIVRTRKPEHALYLGFWAFAHERYIESLHTGSTGQTELPRDHVKAIRFVLPDAATLSWFNSIAEPAVKAIVANQVESKRLEALRDALLPKLMSGEVDVSEVELPTRPNSHLHER